MVAMYDGKPIFGPRGPIGPDGNPIGTVISYMGLTAPKDYLVCDGKEREISEYPELARFFETQFGAKNHFGGDGETTFAVPDLRNLFLRGYHGDADEQLSSDLGKKQEATNHVSVGTVTTGNPNGRAYVTTSKVAIANGVSNKDTSLGEGVGESVVVNGDQTSDPIIPGSSISYTSRPVNAAVLYCIKAVTSVPAENLYSTEEQVVGQWIDGKPLYRKVLIGISQSTINSWNEIAYIDDCELVVSVRGYIRDGNYPKGINSIPNSSALVNTGMIRPDMGDVGLYVTANNYCNQNYGIIVEYTKNTD